MSATQQSVSNVLSYPGFLRRAASVATDGSWSFYIWMTVLTAIALVGANAWSVQVRDGMIQTNMSDHVSWGLYIANFTFCVGLAAGGVMMVIPACLYDDEDMHSLFISGEAVVAHAVKRMCCPQPRGIFCCNSVRHRHPAEMNIHPAPRSLKTPQTNLCRKPEYGQCGLLSRA